MLTCSSTVPTCNAVRVLLVDDEDGFRTSLATMLRDDGHQVADFRAPADVPVATLRGITVAIVDYDMPGQNGLDFADSLHTVHPTVPIVMVTACQTETIEAQAARRPFLSLRPKPLDYDDIHELTHLLGTRA